MAIIRDILPAFDLAQPATVDDALRILAAEGDGAWVIAGGMDSMDWLKDRIKKPRILVDLGGVAELRGVRETGDGIEIGPMTTLTEIATHATIQRDFGLLSQAASLVASPQIRNQGTLGGNVTQDVRCWYYRGGWPCYRAGGNLCFADTPVGRNREHAIFGASRCVAVHPSDTAPALIALDARFVIQSPAGQRELAAEDYFLGPAEDITRIHRLQPGELLTSIRIPRDWAGADFYFEKVRDRQVWDFPLLNVASARVLSGGVIERMRIAVNAAAPTPLRLTQVEIAVQGKPATAATGELAGRLAIEGAVPLQFNAYKIPLLRNLVKRAVTGVAEIPEAAWA